MSTDTARVESVPDPGAPREARDETVRLERAPSSGSRSVKNTFFLVPDGRLGGPRTGVQDRGDPAPAVRPPHSVRPPKDHDQTPPPPMWAVEEVSALGEDTENGLVVVQVPEAGEDSAGVGPLEEATTPSYWFEPSWSGKHPRLVMLAADTAPRARINGNAAPRLAVLSPGDEVMVGGGLLFHVVVHYSAAVLTTPADLLGTECPLCRVPLADGDEVYVCRQCGSGVHYASKPPNPGGPVLECALALRGCPVCDHPVHIEAGFSHEPWA